MPVLPALLAGVARLPAPALAAWASELVLMLAHAKVGLGRLSSSSEGVLGLHCMLRHSR